MYYVRLSFVDDTRYEKSLDNYFWLETDFAVYLKYYLYWNTNNNMALSNGQNSSIQTGINTTLS